MGGTNVECRDSNDERWLAWAAGLITAERDGYYGLRVRGLGQTDEWLAGFPAPLGGSDDFPQWGRHS